MARPRAILPSSGLYHVWIIAIAEVAGQKYACLRLVNAQGEFDAQYHHQHADTPFLHVPSVVIPYDPEAGVPVAYAMAQQALPLIGKNWPALRGGTTLAWKCNTNGAWGGFTPDNKAEPVLRIVLNLGGLTRLPKVVYRPKERVPFQRQPAGWVPFSEIFRAPSTRLITQGTRTSPCVVGKASFPTRSGGAIIARDTILQDTVFGGLSHAMGRYSFSLLPKGRALNPRIEAVGPATPTP